MYMNVYHVSGSVLLQQVLTFLMERVSAGDSEPIETEQKTQNANIYNKSSKSTSNQ